MRPGLGSARIPGQKKGPSKGRPKFWEETPIGRKRYAASRDNALHNYGWRAPAFKRIFPFPVR